MTQTPSPEPVGKPVVPAAPGPSGPKQPAPKVAQAARCGGCLPPWPPPRSSPAPAQPWQPRAPPGVSLKGSSSRAEIVRCPCVHHLTVEELALRLPPTADRRHIKLPVQDQPRADDVKCPLRDGMDKQVPRLGESTEARAECIADA
eukprot:692318-Pleurochrysis_carterae.AAC.1